MRDAIFDGEATVLGNTGLPDFQALRRELRNPESKCLIYHAFDLLYLNGRDFRRAPLLQRKEALKSVLENGPPTLVYTISCLRRETGAAGYSATTRGKAAARLRSAPTRRVYVKSFQSQPP